MSATQGEEFMITVSDLTFDYASHRALHQVSFTLEAGSVTALVGPNGAGKTTLMRCIAGLEVPLSGTITVADMDVIERPREVHRLMGYLSDFFGLYQELTVAQCLEYAAASQGLPPSAIEGAVRDTAQRLGLADRLSQVSGTLSRGLRQRVAIGQAIIHNPRVLLLDEPASGLDPEARASLAALFRQLQASGMTLLVSSHILAELDEYSSHMLALRDGRILEYRALGQNIAAATSRRIRVTLARPDAALTERLRAQAGLTLHAHDESSAEFDLEGDDAAQAALLAALVASGMPVLSFAEHKENLQQSYLRSIENHQSAAGGAA